MNENETVSDNEYSEENNLPDQDITLSDKLDRIEALLNEDIALRQNEQLTTSSGETATVSANEAEPNYTQYIYDLLSDTTLKVEVVQEDPEPITTRKISDYGTNELILLFLVVGSLAGLFFAIVKNSIGNFKSR